MALTIFAGSLAGQSFATSADYLKALRELSYPEVSRPCFCIGPQDGAPHCPCVMRQSAAASLLNPNDPLKGE